MVSIRCSNGGWVVLLIEYPFIYMHSCLTWCSKHSLVLYCNSVCRSFNNNKKNKNKKKISSKFIFNLYYASNAFPRRYLMKNVRDLLAGHSLPAGWQVTTRLPPGWLATTRLPAGWLATRDAPPPSTVPVRHHAWVAAGRDRS